MKYILWNENYIISIKIKQKEDSKSNEENVGLYMKIHMTRSEQDSKLKIWRKMLDKGNVSYSRNATDTSLWSEYYPKNPLLL
jgi:hypothetical protein